MADYAYVYKDGNSPVLGMGRTGGYEAQESTTEYHTFTITVLEEDRDGDVVNPAGLQLKNYTRNPLWFFGHQEWLVPIGTARSPDGRICVFPDVNVAKARFYPDTGDEDAMFIAGKVQRGILSATSIAFVPIKAWKRDEQRKAHQHDTNMSGWFFDEVDLTEISIVGVPSNPYATIDQKNMRGALRDAVDKEGKSIRPRLRKALERYCAKSTNEDGGCWTGWCPRPKQVEKGYDGGQWDSMSTEERTRVLTAIGLWAENAVKQMCQWDWHKLSKNAQANLRATSKSLAESSGAAGGYTVPPIEQKGRDSNVDQDFIRLLRSGPKTEGQILDAMQDTTEEEINDCFKRNKSRIVTEFDDSKKQWVTRLKALQRKSCSCRAACGCAAKTVDKTVVARVIEHNSKWYVMVRDKVYAGPYDTEQEADRALARRSSKQIKTIVVDGVRYRPVTKDIDTQYDQGYVAAHDGRGRETNPYRTDTDPRGREMSDDWLAGWRDGAKERLAGRKSTLTKGSSSSESYENQYGLRWQIPGGKSSSKWFSSSDERAKFAQKLEDKEGDDINFSYSDPQKSIKSLTKGVAGPTRMQLQDFYDDLDMMMPQAQAIKAIEQAFPGVTKIRIYQGQIVNFEYIASKSHHCTFCKGTGSGCGQRGDCPDCGGRGVTKIKRVSCVECGGSGKVDGQRCEDCRGTGNVLAAPIPGTTQQERNRRRTEQVQGKSLHTKRIGVEADPSELASVKRKFPNVTYRYDDDGIHDVDGPQAEAFVSEGAKKFGWKVYRLVGGRVVRKIPGGIAKLGDRVLVEEGPHAGKEGVVANVGYSNSNLRIKFDDGTTDTVPYSLCVKKQARRNMKRRKSLTDEGNPTEVGKDHEVAMAHLYQNAKAEHDFLTEKMESLHPFDPQTGEANKAVGALKDYHEQVGQRMESLKAMFGEHAPEKDLDEMVKGLETSGTNPSDTGEANLVGNGEVPEFEADDSAAVEMDDPDAAVQMDDQDQVKMDDDASVDKGDGIDTCESCDTILDDNSSCPNPQCSMYGKAEDDAVTKEPDEFVEDHDTDEILERYQMGLKWHSRKASPARVAKVLGAGGVVKQSPDGRKWLVAKAVKKAPMSRNDWEREWTRYGEDFVEDNNLEGVAVRNSDNKVLRLLSGQPARVESMFKESYRDVNPKSLKHRRKSLDDAGNPAELKSEHADAVKSCGNMLKGMAAAHDMPEHHKSALDMHGDAIGKALVGEGDLGGAMTAAAKHMKSLADAPDVPEHHKEALQVHGKAMAKACKALEPEEKDLTTEDPDAGGEGNPVEVGKAVGKAVDPQGRWQCLDCGKVFDPNSSDVCPACKSGEVVPYEKSMKADVTATEKTDDESMEKAIEEVDDQRGKDLMKSIFSDLKDVQGIRRRSFNGTK